MANIRPDYVPDTREVPRSGGASGKEFVRNPPRSGRAVLAGALAGLLASALLLFLLVPVAGVLGSDGAAGARLLVGDAELRAALALTAVTATAATLLAERHVSRPRRRRGDARGVEHGRGTKRVLLGGE